MPESSVLQSYALRLLERVGSVVSDRIKNPTHAYASKPVAVLSGTPGSAKVKLICGQLQALGLKVKSFDAAAIGKDPRPLRECGPIVFFSPNRREEDEASLLRLARARISTVAVIVADYPESQGDVQHFNSCRYGNDAAKLRADLGGLLARAAVARIVHLGGLASVALAIVLVGLPVLVAASWYGSRELTYEKARSAINLVDTVDSAHFRTSDGGLEQVVVSCGGGPSPSSSSPYSMSAANAGVSIRVHDVAFIDGIVPCRHVAGTLLMGDDEGDWVAQQRSSFFPKSISVVDLERLVADIRRVAEPTFVSSKVLNAKPCASVLVSVIVEGCEDVAAVKTSRGIAAAELGRGERGCVVILIADGKRPESTEYMDSIAIGGARQFELVRAHRAARERVAQIEGYKDGK